MRATHVAGSRFNGSRAGKIVGGPVRPHRAGPPAGQPLSLDRRRSCAGPFWGQGGLSGAHRGRCPVSRYLHQLARETHSKLRAPFGLRIAPRAPAFYEEIHEERLVSATAASGELSRAPSLSLESLAAEPRIPAARRPELPRVEEASAATVTETPHPLPSAPPVDRSVNAARPM